MATMNVLGRLARHRPALSAVIIGTLALGIGSATALYSVIDAVLLRPYPFRDQDRLAVLWQTDVVRNHPFVEISYLDARDWRSRAGDAFESIASMSSVNFATGVTGAGDPQQVQVRLISDAFFDVLGYAPGPRPHPPRRRSSLRSAARRRHRARRLAAALRRRPGGRRTDDGARSRVAHHRRRHAARADLSRRCRGVGAGRGRGRAESAAESQSVLDGRGEPAEAGRLDRTGAGRARRRDSIADQGAPAEGDGAVPRRRSAARRRVAWHDASGPAPAAVRGRRCAADRLRQRVEPAAVTQRRSPARCRDADHARRLARTAGPSAPRRSPAARDQPAASSASASPGWR